MYTVYILRSLISGKYYKGQTNDLTRRLKEHNNREEISTAKDAPWKVELTIKLNSRSEALALERKLKNITGIKKFEAFIKKYNSQEMGGPDTTPKV